ncbi:MAG: hypothetical protein Kow0042_06550 [Calditrichia bacterium]
MENSSHYFNRTYMNPVRLQAYQDQIDLFLRLSKGEDTTLEVGKGNGYFSHFVKTYLKQEIVTLDLSPELQPDFIGDITDPKLELPSSYDLSVCFEVLEHIPWGKLPVAVSNLRRFTRKWVLISVPDANYFLQVKLNVLWRKLTPLSFTLTLPRLFNNKHPFGKGHEWEIGIVSNGRRVTSGRVIHEILGAENLKAHFRGRHFPGHHFFVLKGDATV